MSQRMIPLSVPNLKGRELEYLTHAVETEWVSTVGPYVDEFEDKVANYSGSIGAVSCQNGTAGLHIALQLCHISTGDEVIVPALTFIASVNPVKYVGAEPVFMDCDDSLTMDVDKLLLFCQKECSFVAGRLINIKTKRHIKAILVVHVFGNMANMEKIMDISKRYNLSVIEDATEALGTCYTEGKYKGKYAGTIGDIGVFSFNGNKIITTGGGGMIVSNDRQILKKAKHLITQAKIDRIYFIHDEIGYNYRMTNLQAALGLAQLEQLEGFIQKKKKNYYLYKEQIKEIRGLSILNFSVGIRPNYWFYSLYSSSEYPLDRDGILEFLASRGIQSRPIWGLICEQKPYIASESYEIKKAKMYLQHVVNIPCSSNLSRDDVMFVVDCLKHPEKV